MTSRASPATAPLRERVLLIAPHGSYRTASFIEAASQLETDILIASQGEFSIVSDYAKGLHIDFQDQQQALEQILKAAEQQPFAGIIATDDIATGLASRAAQALGLPHNDPRAVALTQRKDLARQCLQNSGVNIPAFDRLTTLQPISEQKITVAFPAVIKPVALSASRGVMRVNNQEELEQAFARLKAILDAEQQLADEQRTTILLESFIPGVEVAVEAMLYGGRLHILTIFDKPDPLDGPFFEETYYTTPTSQPETVQQQIHASLQQTCRAYGLGEGPVHAECRINTEGVWILEVAARTIGGLCGRLLSMGTGYSLEQLVLMHAMGREVEIVPMQTASGVLMIPVPKAGILKRVEGLLEAQRVPGIEDVVIEVREGYELTPLPEGNSYLGFIFARADTAQQAEQALRQAHACLNIVVAPLWKINSTLSA